MSKEENVEVTVKVPKRLMQMLEGENYFGWTRDKFFTSAVKHGVSFEISRLDVNEASRLEDKYGIKQDLDADISEKQ